MNSLSNAHNRKLFQDLSALRKGHTSVVWAIIRGRASEVRIGLLLGWPPSLVKKALGTCLDHGMVTQNASQKNDNWQLDREHEDHDRWLEMRALATEIELELVEAYPTARLEEGYLARSTRDKLDPARLTKLKDEAPTYLLRETQWRNLQIIRDHFSLDQVFSTAQYRAARKTSRSDFAENELVALMKKGLLDAVDQPGRSTYWKLNIDGGLYEHEVITQAEKKTVTGKAGATAWAKKKTEDPYLSLIANSEAGEMTTRALAEARGISRSAAHKGMARLLEQGLVVMHPKADGSSAWMLKD